VRAGARDRARTLNTGERSSRPLGLRSWRLLPQHANGRRARQQARSVLQPVNLPKSASRRNGSQQPASRLLGSPPGGQPPDELDPTRLLRLWRGSPAC
jgi:hypothetical protein